MVKFSGFFFDGRTASKVPVDVRLTPQSVLIDAPGKGQKVWPYSEIKLIQTGSRHGPVRLERPVTRYGKECVEAVVIEDPQFLHVAEEVAPGALVSFWKNPKNRNRLRVVVVLALLAIPPFLYGIWTLGLPRLSDAVAEKVPPEWERKLGDTVLKGIIHPPPDLPQGKVKFAMDALEERLLATVPGQPYEFRIYVHPSEMVNALALPGGNIIVFQGLLNLTESPDELAGILAHEFQHVLLRHSTRGIIRQFASSFLLSIVVGDTNGVMNTVMGAAEQLNSLSFSRKMETEADREGMRMLLKAGIDPAGMVHVFEKFREREHGNEAAPAKKNKIPENGKSPAEKTQNDGPSWTDYLSSHPATEDRIVTLQKLSKETTVPTQPLLPEFDWKLMHRELKKKRS